MYIYAHNSISWVKLYDNIFVENTDGYSGYSGTIYSDGNIVDISFPNNDGNGSNSGHVNVYARIGSSWENRLVIILVEKVEAIN